MQYYWNVILEFVRGCIKLLDDKLVPISSDASAIILFVVAVGLIVLLIVIVTTKRGLDKSTPLPRTTVVPLNGTEPSAQMAARLKKVIDGLNKDIDERDTSIKNLQNKREHTSVENLYFAINGIVNSELVLGIALVLSEFLDLRNRSPKQLITALAVAHELGRVMSVLAATMICSAAIVYITWSPYGKSYEKINRAFFISLGISAASFVVFAFLAPPSFQ